VLQHQRLTLIVFLITVATSVVLYVFEPKGFFPQQDTGVLAGLTDTSQDVSFGASIDLQRRIMDVVGKDPDVAGWATAVGGSRPVNTGFAIVSLKPRDERKATADQIIDRLRPEVAQVSGGTLFLQAQQDLNLGGRT